VDLSISGEPDGLLCGRGDWQPAALFVRDGGLSLMWIISGLPKIQQLSGRKRLSVLI
jgi:hypothetical protein